MNGSMSFGELMMLERQASTQSYNASTRARFALSRIAALFGDTTSSLSLRSARAGIRGPGADGSIGQGVRVGLDLWFPLIR